MLLGGCEFGIAWLAPVGFSWLVEGLYCAPTGSLSFWLRRGVLLLVITAAVEESSLIFTEVVEPENPPPPAARAGVPNKPAPVDPVLEMLLNKAPPVG